jgi:hypothetical protein
MNKTVITILFSLIFVSFTVVPSILVIVDDTYDISILISSSEEEEKKGEENIKDIEIEIPSHNSVDPTFHNIALVNSLNYCGNNYSSLFKELTSPPPETNI